MIYLLQCYFLGIYQRKRKYYLFTHYFYLMILIFLIALYNKSKKYKFLSSTQDFIICK